MDIYGNSISPKPVIHLIKEVDETVSDDKTVSDNKTFQQELKELADISEAETETAIKSITVIGIKTSLDTTSITL